MSESGGKRRRLCKAECPDVDRCIHVRKGKDKILELTRQVHFYRNKLLVESERRESVEEQLLTDPLTGACNRRGLEKQFLEECSRVERSNGKKLFMLFMDIDNFHKFNSEHGEHTGDLVLQEVVRTISAGIRPYDSLHRIGGEEFVVLLPELEGPEEETGKKALDNVCATADRIRRMVDSLRVTPHDDSTPLGVTISIGIARLGSGDSLDTLIDKANKAETQAKRTGKNRPAYIWAGRSWRLRTF